MNRGERAKDDDETDDEEPRIGRKRRKGKAQAKRCPSRPQGFVEGGDAGRDDQVQQETPETDGGTVSEANRGWSNRETGEASCSSDVPQLTDDQFDKVRK